ncbi:Glycosyltransferase [Geitlerinema sp. FC II]|nr:Glycosyltransferase [Geitlerinema sp. FC II]
MKILLFTPYGQWGIHNQVDAIAAKALELRGCQSLVVLCDGLYANCTILRDVPTHARNHVCQSCAKAGQQLFTAFQIPQVQLRQFIQPDDREQANQWVATVNPDDYATASYQNLPIGEWVTSSIYTYFRITAKGLQRPDVREVHRRYLIDGIITYKALSRILDRYQPDRIVHFNGRMAPYRIAFELGRSRGLEVLTHERGSIDDSFSFRENAICSETSPVIHYAQTWQNVPLHKNEIEEVRNYFHQRESGKNTNWNPFYTYQTDYSKVRHQLRIPANAKIVSVFTSSEDELALFKDYQGLSNQLEVLQRIIDIFKERDEYLVIRHHPHIGGAGQNRAETDFIARAYQQSLTLPENVRIVMPSEQLTSYALLANTDAALVFFSTVSIEAAARGIPTAVFENSPYRHALSHAIYQDKLDKANLASLIEKLLSPSANLQIADFKKLYRFTYTYFFRFSQKFRSFGVKNRHYFDIRIKSFEELRPGVDPTLDRICNHILTGSPLYEMPNTVDENYSEDEEDSFFTQELQRIAERRNSVNSNFLSSQETPACIIHVQNPNSEVSDTFIPDWQKVSRHQKLASRVLKLSEANTSSNLKSLIDLLSTIEENYVLIAREGFQYNESFVSSAIDLLTDDSEEKRDAVWSGGWIQSPQGNIHQQIFTGSAVNVTYQHATQILPELLDPFILLSFLLMSKTSLISTLQSALSIQNPQTVSKRLFEQVNRLNVCKTGLPLLVVHQDQLQQTSIAGQASLIQPNYTLKLAECYEEIKKQPTSASLYRQAGDLLTQQGKLESARCAYQYADRLSHKLEGRSYSTEN